MSRVIFWQWMEVWVCSIVDNPEIADNQEQLSQNIEDRIKKEVVKGVLFAAQ